MAGGLLRLRSATLALKPLVVAKVSPRRFSSSGCTLWRPSQFGSKHSLVSPQHRLT
jgi:hypothetical protein